MVDGEDKRMTNNGLNFRWEEYVIMSVKEMNTNYYFFIIFIHVNLLISYDVNIFFSTKHFVFLWRIPNVSRHAALDGIDPIL